MQRRVEWCCMGPRAVLYVCTKVPAISLPCWHGINQHILTGTGRQQFLLDHQSSIAAMHTRGNQSCKQTAWLRLHAWHR